MKKHIRKWGALLCAAVMLLVSVPAVPAHATSANDVDIDYFGLDLKKVADIILAKQGVVPAEHVLDEVVDDWVNGLSDVLTSTVDLVTFNSTDACDRATFEDNLDVAGVTGYEREVLLNAYDVYCTDGTYSWLDKAENYDSMVTNGLKRYLCEDAEHDGDGIRRGTTYTVPEDAVKDVCNTFQTWWSANGDYIIYRVPAVTELPVVAFKTKSAIEQLKNIVSAIEEEGGYAFASQLSNGYSGTSYGGFVTAFKSDVCYFVADGLWGTRYNVQAYDANWSLQPKHNVLVNGNTWSYSYQSDDFVYEYHEYQDATISGDGFQEWYYYSKYSGGGIILTTPVSTVAHNIKIFRKVEQMKLYDCGQQSVYFSPTYDSSVINTVTYTGDYYCDNSGVYNYGTVQDSINNIDGDVTDSIVDSVVDESVTNITNNYYYGTGSGDGGSSGDDDSKGGIFERLLDAIGNVLGDLLGLLEEIVDLFLSAIVEAIGVIIQGLTGAIAKLRELSIQVEGVTGFLSEFFGFVPVDYWDMITSVMLIALVVAVIRIFKK